MENHELHEPHEPALSSADQAVRLVEALLWWQFGPRIHNLAPPVDFPPAVTRGVRVWHGHVLARLHPVRDDTCILSIVQPPREIPIRSACNLVEGDCVWPS